MRTGIIGCGHIAEKHLHQLRRMQGIRLVGVCDRDPLNARTMAGRFAIDKDFREVGNFLREVSPQVVHILTPPKTHQAIALDAIAAGSHVLVEKPLAVEGQGAQTMVDAARRNRVRLGVCHNYLFVPAFAAALGLIERGRLGLILSAELFWKATSFETDPSRGIPPWVGELPGDIFHEIAPHPVYLLQAVLGELRVVSAAAKKRRSDRDHRADELKVLFDSESGLGSMSISVGTQPVQKILRVYGTASTLHIDLATSTLLELKPRSSGDAGRALVNMEQSLQMIAKTGINAFRHVLRKLPRGHAGAITHFYERLADGLYSPIDGAQGAKTVSVLDRIWSALKWSE